MEVILTGKVRPETEPKSEGAGVVSTGAHIWSGKWYFRGCKNRQSTFSYKIKFDPSAITAGMDIKGAGEKEEGSAPAADSSLIPPTKPSPPSVEAGGESQQQAPLLSLPFSSDLSTFMEDQTDMVYSSTTPEGLFDAAAGGALGSSLAILEDEDEEDQQEQITMMMMEIDAVQDVNKNESGDMPTGGKVKMNTASPPVSQGGSSAAGGGGGYSSFSIYAPWAHLPAKSSCEGAFVVHSVGGAETTSIAETFELNITGPITENGQVEVVGEGINIYGEFILKGKIDLREDLRMICHRMYKEGSRGIKRARRPKQKQEQQPSQQNLSAQGAGAAEAAAQERRTSRRMTLGVRKTPFFPDEDNGGLTATFASSSSGKLLGAIRACNRVELKWAWNQWSSFLSSLPPRVGAQKRMKMAWGEGGTYMSDEADGKEGEEEDDEEEEEEEEIVLPGEEDGWVPALADEEGEVYEGEVEDGDRHGMGICVFPNGFLYQGQWRQGKEHGIGKLMTHSRTLVYDGEWVEGKMNGKGTYTFRSGGIYEGDWRENMRHGKGTYRLPDGGHYEGEWKEDFRSGWGVFTWPDGSLYEGEWVRGKRQGRGMLRGTAFEYNGQWIDNKMEGKGICHYADGQHYEGMWRQGKKDGRGTLTFSNGANYEGRFKEDTLDGQGTFEVSQPVSGAKEGEWIIPLDLKVDIARAHIRAGFGQEGR